MPRLREPRPKQEIPPETEVIQPEDNQIEQADGSQIYTSPKPFEGEEPKEESEELFGAKPPKEKQPRVAEAATEKAPEPEEENSLQKQIEALRRSEELNRQRLEQITRERDEAVSRHRETETEVSKTRKESLQYQLDSISTAMGAAQSEAEAAKRDIKTAIGNGDSDAQAEALDRLATARANIAKLEDGKFELEARIKEPDPEPKESPSSSDQLERLNIPTSAKDWLRKHPEYLTNPRLNAKIQALHYDVLDEGHSFGDAGYFEAIETKLGMRKAQTVDDDDEEPEPSRTQPQRTSQRSSIVSAPVSRDVPSSTGRRQNDSNNHMTRDEREAARVAGITDVEYIKQRNKIRELKANGQYGGQT